MRLITLLVSGVILGIVGHKADGIISSWEHTPNPWKRLARYTVGSILVTIMFIPLKSHLARQTNKELIDADIVAITLSNTAVGLGVTIGYVWDGIRENET